MDPAELHSDYLRNRFNSVLQESARQRELPSLRQRLAYRFQAFAQWLEPDLGAPRGEEQRGFRERSPA